MRLKAAVLATVACLVVAATATADSILTINFDDLYPLTPVTDQYAALGIRFTTQLLDTLPNVTVSSAALSQSRPNVLASAFGNIDGVISFSFDQGASSVGFTAVSVELGVTATYLNMQGAPIFVDTRPAGGNFWTPVPFEYTNPPEPIGAVVIQAPSTGSPDSFGIDDVQFTLVPEPASALLLAAALPFLLRRRS